MEVKALQREIRHLRSQLELQLARPHEPATIWQPLPPAASVAASTACTPTSCGRERCTSNRCRTAGGPLEAELQALTAPRIKLPIRGFPGMEARRRTETP